MTYAQLLQWLLAFGAKLPQIVSLVQQLIALFQSNASMFAHSFAAHEVIPLGSGAELLIPHPDAEIHALEQKVLAAYKSHGPHHLFSAIGDGSILAALRNIMAFIKENPQIWAFIVKLLPLLA